MKAFQFVLVLAIQVCLAGAAAAQNSFFAILTSAAVCNKPPSADPPLCRLGAGQAGGTATVMIFGPNHLCAAILVHHLSLTPSAYPIAAHLHTGEASYSGPVVVQLGAPVANGGGNPGTSMMCNTAVPAAAIASIRGNPQFYYIDIHGGGFQFGALRGQLF